MSGRSAAAASLLLICAACGAIAHDTAATGVFERSVASEGNGLTLVPDGSTTNDPMPLDGRPRPPAASRSFDYDALPIVELADGEAARRAPTFKYHPPLLTMKTDLFAEVQIGRTTLFSGPLDFPVAAGPIGRSAAVGCPRRDEVVEARWAGFSASGSTNEHLEFHVAEGLFGWSSCTVEAKWAASFDAPALVSGFVYAFRARPDVTERGETLGVVLPHATWVSVSSPREGSTSLQGPFTSVRMKLEAGKGQSFVARLTASDLAAWARLRASKRPIPNPSAASDPADALLFALDVSFVGETRVGRFRVGVSAGVSKKPYEAFLRAAEGG